MKRYYISPIIITEDEDGHTVIKVKAAGYPKAGYVTDIPSDPTTGLPLFNWALVQISGTQAQHQAILADTDIYPVPHNDNPDDLITLSVSFRKVLNDRAISNSSRMTLRQLTTAVGKKVNQNFDFERFFVSE